MLELVLTTQSTLFPYQKQNKTNRSTDTSTRLYRINYPVLQWWVDVTVESLGYNET